MPIYEYICEQCNKHLEIIQKITEKPLTACPDCDGALKKMISNTSFVLKGTGWYMTDYASGKNSAEKSPPAQKQTDSTTTAETTTKTAEAAPKATETAVSSK